MTQGVVKKAKWGGKRAGAGRPKGANKARDLVFAKLAEINLKLDQLEAGLPADGGERVNSRGRYTATD
jgi:hypothetical protein